MTAAASARAQHPERDVRPAIVYGGDEASTRHGVRVIPWTEIGVLGETA